MADDSRLRTARSNSYDAYADATQRKPTATGGDPLAELARLIGQDNLFEDMRRDAARTGKAEPRVEEAPQTAAYDLRGPIDPPASPEPPASATHYERRSGRDSVPDHATDLGLNSLQLNGLDQAGTAASTEARPPRRSRATPRPIEEIDAEQAQAPTQHSYARSAPADRRSYAEPSYDAEPAYAERAQAERSYAQPAHAKPAYAEPRYAEEAVPARSPASAEAHHAHADAYDDPNYDPAYAYDDPEYDEPPVRERRRGGMMIAAAVAGLAVAGTAGAFAYWSFSGDGASGEPPIITANPVPGKVTPAAQNRSATGGAADRGRGGERVVSREEQPVELQQARSQAPRVMGQGSPTSMVGVSGQSSVAMVPPTTASAAAGSPDAPRRVKTIAIRPDGSVATDPPRPQAAPQVPAAAPAAPTRTASIPPTVATPPAVAGTHVVQVASQRSEQDAQSSFRALQAKYPSVLGNREPLIRRIELGERGTFFRVQVGPFSSADQANDLCSNLKAAGGQCIVQRN